MSKSFCQSILVAFSLVSSGVLAASDAEQVPANPILSCNDAAKLWLEKDYQAAVSAYRVPIGNLEQLLASHPDSAKFIVPALGSCYEGQANLFEQVGDFQSALASNIAWLKLMQAHSEPGARNYFYAARATANSYYHVGDHENAAVLLRQQLRVHDKPNNQYLLSVLRALAYVEWELKNSSESMALLKRAQALSIAEHARYGMVDHAQLDAINIAALLAQSGDVRSAIDVHEKLLREARSRFRSEKKDPDGPGVGTYETLIVCLRRLAELEQLRGKGRNAKKYSEEAQALENQIIHVQRYEPNPDIEWLDTMRIPIRSG